MNTLIEILFVVLMTCPFWGVLLFALSMLLEGKYIEYKCKKIGSNQHLTFGQLKKGDFVWEVDGEILRTYLIKSVYYNFRYDNKLSKITIAFKNRPYVLKIDGENAKSFRYLDYFTLYGEALVTQKLNIVQRNEEIKKAKTVSIDELKKTTDRVLKVLENCEKILSKK